MGSQQFSHTKTAETIGILGGGQLAQMICQSALKHGLQTMVFAQNSIEPAVKWATKTVFAQWDNTDELAHFLEQCTHVIFESEFVPLTSLKQALEKIQKPQPLPQRSMEFFPPLEAIEVAQNKLTQKRLFQELGLPSSAFSEIPSTQALDGNFWQRFFHKSAPWRQDDCLNECGVVIKWSRLGYDGKGTLIFAPGSFSNDQIDSIVDFCRRGVERDADIYVEEYIPFIKELAQVGTAHADKISFYPLIETKQKGGICRWTRGPMDSATNTKWQPETQHHWLSIAKALNYIGTMAIEYFLCPKGKIFINELAPRVHNSGHITQDAFSISQFDDNILAVVSTWNKIHWSTMRWGAIRWGAIRATDADTNSMRSNDEAPYTVDSNIQLHKEKWPHWAMFNLIGRPGQTESKIIRNTTINSGTKVATEAADLRSRINQDGMDSNLWNEQFFARDILLEAIKQTPFNGEFSLHWYDKAQYGSGRKMGHINFVSQNAITDEVLEQLAHALNSLW